MSANLLKILKYILLNYPHKSELSASRVTKMLYLIDWKSAIEQKAQLTDIKWYFNHYGPYVGDLMEIARKDDEIYISAGETVFGGRKNLISLSAKCNGPINLDPNEKSLVDFVIDKTKVKNYDDFIKLVYSTYPVMTSSKYSELDLVSSAKAYSELVEHKRALTKA